LNLRVVEITENVLQLFELADEPRDGCPGIQAGEELQEVAQLLAVDSKTVEQVGWGIDVDSCAAFPHSPVGLEDLWARHLDDRGGCERWPGFLFLGLEDSWARHLDDRGGCERWPGFLFWAGFQKPDPVFDQNLKSLRLKRGPDQAVLQSAFFSQKTFEGAECAGIDFEGAEGAGIDFRLMPIAVHFKEHHIQVSARTSNIAEPFELGRECIHD